MKIKVTQENIDECTPGSPFACPIAMALRDAGYVKPRVGKFKAEMYKPRTDAWSGGLEYVVVKPSAMAFDFIT